ncbi:MAG: HAMP domain-containing sensor histidine kinase [Bryobacteraceae bacterium]|nr:HAMP domain-containing sensor histidine kinase [Bryobacteraceae bacterium]
MSLIEQPDLNLRGVVHDLNNVFQTILDAAELLADRDLAAAIERSASHGQRLIRGLVETAAPVTFDYIARSAIQFARALLDATHWPHVEFTADIPEGLSVGGNPVDWERVLVNLLLNSAQAMPKGGAVAITARGGADGISIRVADNGPGVPSGILPMIFEPHFSTKPANSGLGLHIVRSLVERHGGTVRAANQPAGGAEFVIALPA